MSARHGFSNTQLDAMILASGDNGFTRQIPDGEIAAAFPYYIGENDEIRKVTGSELANGGWNRMVVPAKESNCGRGQPVFDLFHTGLPIAGVTGVLLPMLWSFKITSEKDRNPRNAPVTTGKADRHIVGVIRAAKEKTEINMINLNYQADKDQWYQLTINVSEVLRAYDPVPATGARGKPLTLSVKRQKSGGRFLYYRSLRCNFEPCTKLGFTEGWIPVDVPVLPTEATL